MEHTPEMSLWIIRTQIDTLLATKGPDAVAEIPGIEIREKADPTNKAPIDCLEYLYGPGTDIADVAERVTTNYEPTYSAPGALAMYLDDYGYITHVGKVADDGDIISKWGPGGHVYKHKPQFVPRDYGNILIFFNDPQLKKE